MVLGDSNLTPSTSPPLETIDWIRATDRALPCPLSAGISAFHPWHAVLDVNPAAPQIHQEDAIPNDGYRGTQVFPGVQVLLKQITER
jgi:hypothetical protein